MDSSRTTPLQDELLETLATGSPTVPRSEIVRNSFALRDTSEAFAAAADLLEQYQELAPINVLQLMPPTQGQMRLQEP
jgi:hypothetical protein